MRRLLGGFLLFFLIRAEVSLGETMYPAQAQQAQAQQVQAQIIAMVAQQQAAQQAAQTTPPPSGAQTLGATDPSQNSQGTVGIDPQMIQGLLKLLEMAAPYLSSIPDAGQYISMAMPLIQQFAQSQDPSAAASSPGH